MELEDEFAFKFLTKMQKTLQQLETRLIILQVINVRQAGSKNFRLFFVPLETLIECEVAKKKSEMSFFVSNEP